MPDTAHPWLPKDTDETFDPLEHADIEPSPETPLVITPRGGDREVGRSCYQVDTEHGRYLVDCGLSQGTGDKFPDLRGLQPQSIDAVFLTVGTETNVDMAAISPEEIDSTGYTELEDQIDHLYDLLSKLNEEVASARNEAGLSEAEIREVVQDEMETKE
ncbi:metal-dependent RNase [Halorubrum sp. AJ67]|nr:MBL fold metallo-hydrolase [Halorubrum sp. AJ67]CDK39065.1 metal-dependent RNase [Halorubrum sp. AJ67]